MGSYNLVQLQILLRLGCFRGGIKMNHHRSGGQAASQLSEQPALLYVAEARLPKVL